MSNAADASRRLIATPAVQDLAAQAAMYRLIVESAIDIIIRYDATGARTYVSPSCREVLGYEPEEMIGKHAAQLVHPDDFGWADPRVRACGPDNPMTHFAFRALRKDGGFVWVESKRRYLAEDGGAIAVIRDITAQKAAEQMLEEANAKLAAANDGLRSLAQEDGLTGLANRRRFDELLDEEFRRARRHELPLGLVLIDVDCFKAYNDRYGHLAGDDCLRRVGGAIEAVLRRPGDHAARYGGEEFVAILPATDHDGTLRVADHIRRSVEHLRLDHHGSPFSRVTISVGASAVVPFGDANPEALIRAADDALYQAKADGRNCIRGMSNSRVAGSVGVL